MKNLKNKIADSPYILLILGFLSVILIGAILLAMPFCSESGNWTPFLTALFTSTSATCVTGLVLVDTGTYFNAMGQTIIMLLIQIGGIGIMAFIVICIQMFKGKLSIKNKLNIQETYNSNGMGNGLKTIKAIFLISLIIEFIGAILLSFTFIPQYGVAKGLFYSLFHSISAFNNAGFDLNGNFSSLTNYVGNPLVNYTIIGLILLGSLGFLAILDIIKVRKFKKLTLNTKVVLTITTVLLVIGTLIFFMLEYNNPNTMGDLTPFEKFTASMFLAVTPKTAGFNTINMSGLTLASSIIVILFMYIGASPTSTGGGLKTTTILIPILSIIALFKGKEDIEIFERRISRSTVAKSISVICIYFLFSVLGVIILAITENADFLTILFEVASAVNTVGLSLGLTGSLSTIGQIVIMILMFIGRIGPLTIILSLSLKQKNESKIKFVEEKILIG